MAAVISLCGGAGTIYDVDDMSSKKPMTITGFNHNYSGWMVREKLDGVAAKWDGPAQTLYNRGGGAWPAPEEWKRQMPKHSVLQGELVLKHNHTFSNLSGVVRRKVGSWDWWKDVQFGAYESVEPGKPYYLRAVTLTTIVRTIKEIYPDTPLFEIPLLAKNGAVEDNDELAQIANEVLRKPHGEGVVIYDPAYTGWSPGNRDYMKKVVGLYREEVVVIGHSEGGGKFKGMMGAYQGITAEHPRIWVQCSGQLTNDDRLNPEPIGGIIVVQHKGRDQKNGYNLMRMPVYVAVRPKEDCPEEVLQAAKEILAERGL